MQHVEKNAARTGGDDFEREIALDVKIFESTVQTTPMQ